MVLCEIRESMAIIGLAQFMTEVMLFSYSSDSSALVQLLLLALGLIAVGIWEDRCAAWHANLAFYQKYDMISKYLYPYRRYPESVH